MSAERYTLEILTEIESGRLLSQRSLAARLDIALGLANLLVRRTVSKGWVRVVQARRNRVRYLLTPAGFAEKARVSRLMLQDSVRYYASIRDRVRDRIAAVDRGWDPAGSERRVAFFGATEVAEIAYICLPETTLQLVAIVGQTPRRRFLGLPVHALSDMQDGVVGDVPFERLIVTSFERLDEMRAQLDARGVHPSRVEWV